MCRPLDGLGGPPYEARRNKAERDGLGSPSYQRRDSTRHTKPTCQRTSRRVCLRLAINASGAESRFPRPCCLRGGQSRTPPCFHRNGQNAWVPCPRLRGHAPQHPETRPRKRGRGTRHLQPNRERATPGKLLRMSIQTFWERDRYNLCQAPYGPLRQMEPVPVSLRSTRGTPRPPGKVPTGRGRVVPAGLFPAVSPHRIAARGFRPAPQETKTARPPGQNTPQRRALANTRPRAAARPLRHQSLQEHLYHKNGPLSTPKSEPGGSAATLITG